MSKYEITADVIKDIANICPDTLKVMKKHYPDVFEEKEEWVDITREIEWKTQGGDYVWLIGLYRDYTVVCMNPAGKMILNNPYESNYKVKYPPDNMFFKILKKVVK